MTVPLDQNNPYPNQNTPIPPNPIQPPSNQPQSSPPLQEVSNASPPPSAPTTNSPTEPPVKPPTKKRLILPLLAVCILALALVIIVSVPRFLPHSNSNSSWSTYTNPDLGVSFSYPPEFPPPTVADTVGSCSPSQCWSLSLTTATDFTTLAEAYAQKDTTVTSRQIDGDHQVYVNTLTPATGHQASAVVNLNDGRYLTLTLTQKDVTSTPDALKNELTQILDTFTFPTQP